MKRKSMSSSIGNFQTTLFCWGNTANGELGLGGIEENHVTFPRQLTNFANVNQIRDCCLGKNHTAILLNDGKVYTCGSNDLGQLGHFKSHKKFEQVVSLSSHIIKQISTKGDHTLALNEAGQVFSWGSNQYGQLGLQIEEHFLSSPKMIKFLAHFQVIQIACGGNHSLALTIDGRIFSWGHNNFGQLGQQSKQLSVNIPKVMEYFNGIPIAQITAGGNHCFVLTHSGMLYGWGRNTFGQLGFNTENQSKPFALISLKSQQIKYICCGDDHTAALTKDGGVFTFGAGMYGQLGHGTRSNELLPRQVLELMGTRVSQITCGRCHTLALVPQNGKIYAFGLGGNGQLGTGKTMSCMTPTLVDGPWNDNYQEQNSSNDSASNNINASIVPSQGPDKKRKGHKLESLFSVYKIISGGDQSMIMATTSDCCVSSFDFRVSPSSSQILKLTPSLVNRIEIVKEGPYSQELLTDLEIIFSSPQCLNSSFLLPNDQHYICCEDNLGICLSEVFNGFNVIEEAHGKTITDLISGCLEHQLFPSLKKLGNNKEAFRLFILLPFCHLFHKTDTHIKPVIIPFGAIFLNLPLKAIKVIESWWRKFEVFQFRNLIQIYKKALMHLLSQVERRMKLLQPEKNQMIKVCLEFLKHLNEANHNHCNFVSYTEFYIPELTDFVDVKADYTEWIERKRDNGKYLGLFYCDYPFLFDTKAKMIILQEDSIYQMRQAISATQTNFLRQPFFATITDMIPYLVLVVNRENLVGDALNQLASKSTIELKKPLKISFKDEEAVDAGGVKKEFFMLLLTEILDPKYGMFKEYPETRCIWFHSESFEDDSMFYLIGMICGLAIYNFTIINLPFPLVLYKKLLNKPTNLEDLYQLSPSTARSLQEILKYEEDDFEETFVLFFEISNELYGQTSCYELKEGGKNISVTKENREEYVNLYVDFILNKSIKTSWKSFSVGFDRVCGTKIMDLFHPKELMSLVIGKEEYDWELFEKNAGYKSYYHAKHPVIRMFWNVFHKLSHEDKKKFLLYLTGSDRIPLSGMESVPIFIQPMKTSDHHLPVAHTCFNLLDLPEYSSEKVLKEKILVVIQHTQGFGLA